MIGIFIAAIIIGVIAVMLLKKRRSSENKDSIRKLNWSQKTAIGDFKAIGKMNKFIISKDDRFEFIVENGVITACKDKKFSDKFIEYRGNNSAR